MKKNIEKLQSCCWHVMLPWNSEDFEEQSIRCFFVWLNAHFFFDLPPHPSISFCSIKLSACLFPHVSCVCVCVCLSLIRSVTALPSSLVDWNADALMYVCRSRNLLQHAGVSWWSVMGNAGGQDMPAVSKCCGSHSGPQVFFGLFQVVSIHPPQVTCRF